MLAVSYVVMGISNSYPLLLLAFIVSYPAGGAAIDLAQAVIIDAAPNESASTMTRWTLLSSIGDFLAPLTVSAFVALHLGWTELCWLSGVLWLTAALLLAPLHFPSAQAHLEDDESANEMSVWASVRVAVRDPLLLRWSLLTFLPSMLDEVFLGFVVLYLRDSLHVNEALIALIVMLQMLASLAGLLGLERVLKRGRFSSIRLLTWLAIGTLIGVLILLFIHTLWLVILALLLISAGCAGWYPLTKAEAYNRLPGRSGVVRAVIGLGSPLDMALPGVIGLICAHFGILAGLGVLGLAPVLLLIALPHRTHRHNFEGKRRRTI